MGGSVGFIVLLALVVLVLFLLKRGRRSGRDVESSKAIGVRHVSHDNPLFHAPAPANGLYDNVEPSLMAGRDDDNDGGHGYDNPSAMRTARGDDGRYYDLDAGDTGEYQEVPGVADYDNPDMLHEDGYMDVSKLQGRRGVEHEPGYADPSTLHLGGGDGEDDETGHYQPVEPMSSLSNPSYDSGFQRHHGAYDGGADGDYDNVLPAFDGGEDSGDEDEHEAGYVDVSPAQPGPRVLDMTEEQPYDLPRRTPKKGRTGDRGGASYGFEDDFEA